LTEHIDVLHKLAEQLLEKETILGAELDEIIRQVRPGIQLPEKPTDREDPREDNAASAPAENGAGMAEGTADAQTDHSRDSTSQETNSGENRERQ
jgi:cell division protease FtsH